MCVFSLYSLQLLSRNIGCYVILLGRYWMQDTEPVGGQHVLHTSNDSCFQRQPG